MSECGGFVGSFELGKRLVRPFGADRLEAAATRAIEIGTLRLGALHPRQANKITPLPVIVA